MYGDCSKGQVAPHLAQVNWLGGGQLRVTSVNGVNQHLQAVSNELEKLPNLKIFLVPSAGTYNCRAVKDTGLPSMHSWAAAIYINTKYSDYWLWSKTGGYRNRIPLDVIEAFERHGFIWGGKWSHYDTMHFEYRPELLEP